MRTVLLTLTCLTLFQNTFSQIDSLLTRAKDRDAFEEIYVHTDKSNYVSGETIWLKSYLYDGLYPSMQSANLKVQLISNDSTVVADKIYPVINGIASGDIRLPLNLAAGRYFLKAFGDAALRKTPVPYYIAPVIVYNPAGGKKMDSVPYQRMATAQLHSPNPLVAGMGNQVYVSVVDQHKQPMETEGVLLDGSDTVASFTTNSYGIAEMQVIPAENTAYSLALSNTANKLFASLTPIQKEGITMSIGYRDNTYNIFLSATAGLAAKQYKLVAEFNYNLLFTAKAVFTNNATSIKIPAAQLPAGIIRLVLLTGDDEAVCERFVFSTSTNILLGVKQASASLKLVDTATGNVDVVLNDSVENTASLSAVNPDFDFGNSFKQDNIINRFLLTGYFKNSTAAFNGLVNNIQQADVHLINQLLATQPLLKPSWPYIKAMAAAPRTKVAPLEHITIKGTVSPDGFKKLPANATLTMLFTMADSSRSFQLVPLDDDGKFVMDDFVFTDSVKLHYKLNSKTPKDIKLDLQVTDLQSRFKHTQDFSFIHAYPPVQLTNIVNYSNTGIAQKQNELQTFAKDTMPANMLLNVTVNATRGFRAKQKLVNDRYTTDVFIRDASQTMDLINEPQRGGLMTVLDYLRIYGREMQVSNTNIVRNIGWGSGQPYSLFLDQGRVYIDNIATIDMRDVALIKVYSSNFVLADNNGPAIAIYLRKGEDMGSPDDNGMQKTTVAGYSAAKGFPNVNVYNLDKINRQSLLGTFYWSPNISLAGTEAESIIRLYNLNKVKAATITLQGMASDGRLLYWQQQVKAK